MTANSLGRGSFDGACLGSGFLKLDQGRQGCRRIGRGAGMPLLPMLSKKPEPEHRFATSQGRFSFGSVFFVRTKKMNSTIRSRTDLDPASRQRFKQQLPIGQRRQALYFTLLSSLYFKSNKGVTNENNCDLSPTLTDRLILRKYTQGSNRHQNQSHADDLYTDQALI